MLRVLLVALIAMVSLAQAARAETFPSRQVTMIVPYPPGTNADVVARFVADKLSQKFGQRVVVESKAGGATVPGTMAVIHAPADGHTMLVSGTATNVNPVMGVKTSYDAEKDLTPIALLVTFPGVLVVNSKVPVKTVAELVEYSKKQPKPLLYSSPGVGSFPHLAMEQFKQLTGANVEHVPFRGLGPAMIGLLRNDVQISVADIPGALPHIKAGELKALAQTGKQRMPQVPDLPTIAETGVQGYEAAGFLGVWVRTGAPAETVALLNKDVNEALTAPDMTAYAHSNGLLIGGGTPADFVAYMKRDKEIWTPVIQKAGIKISE